MEIETNENNAIIRQQLLQQLQPRVHHAQPLVVAGQVLALFADNRAQPLLLRLFLHIISTVYHKIITEQHSYIIICILSTHKELLPPNHNNIDT